MIFSNLLKQVLFICLFLFGILNATESKNEKSPWRFNAGVSIGKNIPMALVGSIGYKPFLLHIEGLGSHNGPNDFWCGIRGGIDYTFFRDLPFSIDAGISSGYEYAESPNYMHKALNKANNAFILLPYNYVESLDLSIEFRVHLYGFFTQIDYPIYNFMNHDAPNIHWRLGYLVEF